MSLDLTPISMDNLIHLSIDKYNHIYWYGQEIQTSLSLPWWVNVAAIVTAVATSIMAYPTVKRILKDIRDLIFYVKNNIYNILFYIINKPHPSD